MNKGISANYTNLRGYSIRQCLRFAIIPYCFTYFRDNIHVVNLCQSRSRQITFFWTLEECLAKWFLFGCKQFQTCEG